MSSKTTIKVRNATLTRLSEFYLTITSADRSSQRAVKAAGWDVKLNTVFDDYAKRLAEA